MRQLTITIPESQVRRIQKLLRQEPDVIVSKSKPVPAPAKKKLTRPQQAWVDDLKQALVDVERHQRGEIEMMTADEYLEQLRARKQAAVK